MVRKIIITIVVIMAIGFCQTVYKAGGEVRLSPRLLNYQGYLTDTLGNPITNPSISMTFSIFDAVSAGNQKWNETQPTVSVDKGIFHVLLGNVTPIPDSVFNNTNRWLQLSVGGQTLTPRTRIVSAPYAYTATYSDTAQYSRAGAPDYDWIRYASDSILYTVSRIGLCRGNSGNMAHGSQRYTHINFGVACTTGADTSNFFYNTITGGLHNVALGNYTVVAGGTNNIAVGGASFVGSGWNNMAYANRSVVGGGQSDTVYALYGFIGSGYSNLAGNEDIDTANVIAGGYDNSVTGKFGAIGGGRTNFVGGDYSAILGGYADTIASGVTYSYLFGINSNLTQDSTFMVDAPHVRFGTEANGYEFPRTRGTNGQVMATDASGHLSWSSPVNDNDWTINGSNMYSAVSGNVGIGITSPSNKLTVYGTICGGRAQGLYGADGGILAGYNNQSGGIINDTGAVVTGGYGNQALRKFSIIGGGRSNYVGGEYGTIAGGRDNIAYSGYGSIGGGYANYIGWESEHSMVGGGYGDTVYGPYSAVLSGYGNMAGNGMGNTDSFNVVGGGKYNELLSGKYTVIGGGHLNYAWGIASTVAGGDSNIISGDYATIAGGYKNIVYGAYGFAVGNNSGVNILYTNSAAFNGQLASASGQTRVGILAKTSGSFTIDHPLDPENKILNHYFVESPEMSNIYEGEAVLDGSGRAEITLPSYFDALNKTPRIQLTGVGSSDVYVAEKIRGNRFVIGGKPGTEVYWMVTGSRKDPSAEVTRILMPVEQVKEDGLAGHSLDDAFLVSTMAQLERMGKAGGFKFRHASEQNRYEEMKRMLKENK